MAFDPDAYLSEQFDPDAYLGGHPVDADLQSDVPLLPEQIEQLTPEQQKEYFGTQDPKEFTAKEKAVGAFEAAKTLGTAMTTGMAGGFVGGTAQAGREIMSGDFGSYDAAKRISQAYDSGADVFTDTPETEAGIEALQAVGETLEPVGHIGAALGPMATSGLGTMAKAGLSPAGRTVAREAAGLPKKSLAAQIDEVVKAPKASVFERQKIADIRQALKENSAESVGWKLEGNTPKPNLNEISLVDDFKVEPRTLTSIRNLKAQDGRNYALRTLDLAEDYVKGKEGADLARPSRVAGDRLLVRVKYLGDKQELAADKIKAAVGRDLRGKKVDVSDIRDDLAMAIRDRGGMLTKEGRLQLNDLADIQPGDADLLSQAFRRLSDETIDAAELHAMKRTISNKIYGSISGETPTKLSTNAQDMLISVRARINEKLRELSPSYAAANDEFSAIIQPMSEFKKAIGENRFMEIMGKDIDLENTRIGNYTGNQLRKLLSNNQNTDQLISAVESLNKTANDFGGNFKNEIVPLVRLNSDLERILGSFAPQSFQGNIEKAVGVATEGQGGLVSNAAHAAAQAAKKRTGHWDNPVQRQLELINKLREQVKAQ